jgi:hypothetical protein
MVREDKGCPYLLPSVQCEKNPSSQSPSSEFPSGKRTSGTHSETEQFLELR